MGIQQNYLYRVMPGLAEEGKVTKSGRGWHLREGVAESSGLSPTLADELGDGLALRLAARRPSW